MPEGFPRLTNRHVALVVPGLEESQVEGLVGTRHKSLATSYVASILVFFSSLASAATPCHAEQTNQPFTVADEIGLSLVDQEEKAVQVSPDGNYFAIRTERGRLDLNRVEDSLRFYRSQDIQTFLDHSNAFWPPLPIWIVNRSAKEGGIINDWQWLADSSGVAFLERTVGGTQRLALADLRKRTIEVLTSETVSAFAIRDRQHYIYTVSEPVPLRRTRDERRAPEIVGTGRSLFELLLPDDPTTERISPPPSYLWAVVGDERFEVKRDGVPIVPDELALSPDGTSVVTSLPVDDVPVSWETLYPPRFASSSSRIRTGHNSAHQFVRIDLKTGSVQALTDAPTSNDAGWWALGDPTWSSDGQEILLPGTFIKSKDQVPSRPCVAVVDLPSNTRTCVETRKGPGIEDGYHTVYGARFVAGNKRRILVTFRDHQDVSFKATEYRRTGDGAWEVIGHIKGLPPEVGPRGVEVAVKQAFTEPPLLVATNKRASRIIWDPNPQLKSIELTEASIYRWKDKEGRNWRGGLFKPSNYRAGKRYPLVIQTHGFLESEFRPSGMFPTAFAARAIAAAGIMVLQVLTSTDCPTQTPDEGLCAVSGYQSAGNQLVSEGFVDPGKIGIIGFSRTCFYVMEALTESSLHLEAALVTDGVMLDYFQYTLAPDRLSREYDSLIGAPPFGEGLQQWLKLSPTFNLDKVSAPLLVVAEGSTSLLTMWWPYAGLHHLHKPVDLIMLNTDEHILTNPAVRMVSQGGSVDWFRFWLQDYEDLDPAKAEQYKRWRGLRKLQQANERNSTAPSATSN